MKYKISVIGDPIEHSLSPLIHTTVLDFLGIDYEYDKTSVKKNELREYIKYARDNINGFNVTMPHKQSIMSMLDGIDEEARMLNSVNTVKNIDGKLFGYNTDAEGYKMALLEYNISLKNSDIVVFGAGGAASSIILKAAMEEARSISVLNRNKDRIEALKKNVYNKTGFFINCFDFTDEMLKKCSSKADILINATPLGMSGIDDDFSDLSFIDYLKKDAVVSDLIYNPETTKLLKYSKEKGKKTVGGLGMLVYQGLFAEKIFLGKGFDFLKIKEIIREKYENMYKTAD